MLILLETGVVQSRCPGSHFANTQKENMNGRRTMLKIELLPVSKTGLLYNSRTCALINAIKISKEKRHNFIFNREIILMSRRANGEPTGTTNGKNGKREPVNCARRARQIIKASVNVYIFSYSRICKKLLCYGARGKDCQQRRMAWAI